ncbi:MAG: carboxypeptidase regulatory-like domain-containing protein [Muribaculaceae bacterium]|nr:carboxypeptidase regulatory-like domain-containing protein [Muribaculaceae bacterium]
MKQVHAFLLAAVVAIATMTAAAQALPGKQVKKASFENAKALAGLVSEKTVAQPFSFPAAPQKDDAMCLTGKTSKSNAPRRATVLIETPPEGTVKYYTRSGSTYNARNYGNTPQAQEGVVTIVFCDNNEVYIQNPVSSAYQAGTYVKGTLEGNTITVQLPQTLWSPNTSYSAELAWLDITPYVDGTATSYYDPSITADRTNTTAVYTIEDGVISLQGSSSTYVLAAVWDDDNMWHGSGDFESVYTETTLEEPITPPAGITPVTYYYTGNSYYSSASHAFSSTVNVVKDGNDVYIQGLATGDADYEILPDAWAMGTLNGNTLTIPMGQYMGLYSGSPMYLVGYSGSAAADVTFTYDADANTFTLDNLMFVNGKKDAIYYYTYTEAGALITLEEPTPEPEPELVVVPETATIEDGWSIEASGSKTLSMATQVAFDGNDVYFQGVPYYFSTAWIKGTIADGVASFPSGQFVGSDSYGNEFIVSYDGSDIQFTYDAENHVFTLASDYVIEYSEPTYGNGSMWVYFTSMSVYKGEIVEPEVVEVPEGLTTEVYTWTGSTLTFDDDNNAVYTDFTNYINVGYDGNEVYVQGLCADLHEAWVKGTIDGTTATFAAGQYFGTDDRLAAYGYTYPHYFVGYDGSDIKDVVFTFDSEAKSFITDDYIIDNEEDDALSYYVIYTDNAWNLLHEVAGKPAAPSVTGWKLVDTSYPLIHLDIPLEDVDGNQMNPNKVFYRIFTDVEHDVQQLAFTPDDYRNVTETMYEIPYTFDDDWDIYEGGATVYLNQDLDYAAINRIGVQVVYYGGMNQPTGLMREPADNESDIVWQFIKDYTPTVRTITGTVYDQNNQPLAGVTVTATAVVEDEPAGMLREPAETYTTVTGDDGTYSIEVPASATYTLTFEKEGYKSQTVAESDATSIILEDDAPTAVSDVNSATAVAGVKYYNAAGLVADKPFDGVNIVVRRMSDGSVTVTKVIK